ncbi:hypothetical protein MJ575_02855 [Klebsiella pneumoniae]|nr:hypothetical protein MJ575_02855 [Klebsiella pneumoniae]
MFESIHILTNVMPTCWRNVNGITANSVVCEGIAHNSIGIVTHLNPFIGHHNGAISSARFVPETGKSVRWEVVLERGLLTAAELMIFSLRKT